MAPVCGGSRVAFQGQQGQPASLRPRINGNTEQRGRLNERQEKVPALFRAGAVTDRTISTFSGTRMSLKRFLPFFFSLFSEPQGNRLTLA